MPAPRAAGRGTAIARPATSRPHSSAARTVPARLPADSPATARPPNMKTFERGQPSFGCCSLRPDFRNMEGNPVLALVQSLAPAVSYKESNFESNKKIWNLYAKVRPPPPRGRRGSRALTRARTGRRRTGSPTATGCARWQTTWATSGRCRVLASRAPLRGSLLALARARSHSRARNCVLLRSPPPRVRSRATTSSSTWATSGATDARSIRSALRPAL